MIWIYWIYWILGLERTAIAAWGQGLAFANMTRGARSWRAEVLFAAVRASGGITLADERLLLLAGGRRVLHSDDASPGSLKRPDHALMASSRLKRHDTPHRHAMRLNLSSTATQVSARGEMPP